MPSAKSKLTEQYQDTNFYFRYSVNQSFGNHKYLLFKASINGRHIVSWGVKLSDALQGATHQALFEPSVHYQHVDNGVLLTEYGIESRCFRFLSCGSKPPSVADDGGLIEIQVFRAKTRIRRAPRPDEYRGSDNYGIAYVMCLC